jgi:hypothetical protein
VRAGGDLWAVGWAQLHGNGLRGVDDGAGQVAEDGLAGDGY